MRHSFYISKTNQSCSQIQNTIHSENHSKRPSGQTEKSSLSTYRHSGSSLVLPGRHMFQMANRQAFVMHAWARLQASQCGNYS